MIIHSTQGGQRRTWPPQKPDQPAIGTTDSRHQGSQGRGSIPTHHTLPAILSLNYRDVETLGTISGMVLVRPPVCFPGLSRELFLEGGGLCERVRRPGPIW